MVKILTKLAISTWGASAISCELLKLILLSMYYVYYQFDLEFDSQREAISVLKPRV